MKKKFFILILPLTILITDIAFAQLTVKTEIRNRTEARFGYRNLPDTSKNMAFLTSQRTRIGLNYKSKYYETLILLQDVRVWGDQSSYSQTSLNGDPASVELKEGWVKLIFNNSIHLKLGRQEWAFDDERLLSKRDWPGSGLSYDATLITFSHKKVITNMGLSWNNKDENLFGNDYRYFSSSYVFDTSTQKTKLVSTEIGGKLKTLNFLHIKFDYSKNFSATLLGVLSGWQPQGKNDGIFLRQTAGAFLSYNGTKFKLDGSAYYQLGKNQMGQPVSAYFFSSKLFFVQEKFRIGACIDYLSGNDATNLSPDYATTDHLFDLLYGNRHKYYGHLDYFSNIDKSTRKGGLIDNFMMFSFKPDKKKDFALDIHYFLLQNNVYNLTGNKVLDNKLGLEIDAYSGFKILENVDLKLGYSCFFATDSLIDLQGLDANISLFPHWLWFIISVKPEFLLIEK